MVSAVVPVLRPATVEDLDAIAEVMRVSVLDLFPAFYDERQTTSAAVHIAHVDPMLIADGTYFVFVAEGEIVACGGWSRRGRLYAGDGERCSYARTGPGGDWAERFWKPAETPPAPGLHVSI